MIRARTSILHLQMGQEVIYLLLMASILCNVLLAVLLVQASEDYKRRERAIAERPVDDRPPIVNLREVDGFSFAPGSAEVSPDFLARIRELIPKLSDLGQKHTAQIVEVIGHTDGVSLGQQRRSTANLDEALTPFFERASAQLPIPFDNVGLGMARALSVARALRENGLPARFDVQPLSAAHMIATTDRVSPAPARDDPSRRRIEIRLRRLNPT